MKRRIDSEDFGRILDLVQQGRHPEHAAAECDVSPSAFRALVARDESARHAIESAKMVEVNHPTVAAEEPRAEPEPVDLTTEPQGDDSATDPDLPF